MTRSIIIAILTFGLLIVANMAVFGVFGFRTLSERMVTERLVDGLNETARLAGRQFQSGRASLDGYQLSEAIAPQLRGYRFINAVNVYNARGELVHRVSVKGRGYMRVPSAQPNLKPEPPPADSPWRVLPVRNTRNLQAMGHQLALEYDENVIRQEVETLRSEFYQKMWLAIGLSLALLALGLGYVIYAYRRNKKLEETARRADRMAYVGTLSSGLAHEIRNPLNSMNMNVQLIEEELHDLGVEEDSEIREMLAGARREVGRLERLVSSFLAYARPTDLETRPTSVNELVRDILGFLDQEIRSKGIALHTTYGDGIPELPIDPGQMKQALLNVIQNAVSVLQPDERLEIATRRAAGDNILIQIRDEGPGISPEELKNIFKEFYSTRIGGTGLGLPIAQRIVELHGGGIKVDSAVGQGTTFTFILPIHKQEAA